MSRFSVALLAVLCLVVAAAPVHGWWCNGHMLVAEIARRQLNPDVAELMEKIASNLSATGPFPENPDFVQLACWADDLKSKGLRVMGGWHYIDTPYNPEGVPIKKWPVEDKNVKTVLEDLVQTLQNNVSSPYVTNFALANLIHFYGDIHQPLHATTLFSVAYPSGDNGGNAEKVKVNGATMTLHALWDSICQGPQRDPKRPLLALEYTRLKSFADYLEKKYVFSTEEMNEKNFSRIAEESYNVAVNVVYPGVENGMVMTEEYLTKCKAAAEPRVALAGYRLASHLNFLFSNSARATSGKHSGWMWSSLKNASSSVLRVFRGREE